MNRQTCNLMDPSAKSAAVDLPEVCPFRDGGLRHANVRGICLFCDMGEGGRVKAEERVAPTFGNTIDVLRKALGKIDGIRGVEYEMVDEFLRHLNLEDLAEAIAFDLQDTSK